MANTEYGLNVGPLERMIRHAVQRVWDDQKDAPDIDKIHAGQWWMLEELRKLSKANNDLTLAELRAIREQLALTNSLIENIARHNGVNPGHRDWLSRAKENAAPVATGGGVLALLIMKLLGLG